MSDINTTAEGIIMCRESILKAKEGIDVALAHLLKRMKEAAAEWDDESYRQLKERFGADISSSQALAVTDYDSYLAGRDRYVSLFGRLLAESGAPDPETVSGCRELFSRLLPAEVLSKVVGPVCSRR
ncbi:MAG: hypothetical protein IKG08_09455 [Eubacterium sp.]|nr:hypothetical protein [Eubacterium sp.]